MKRTDRPRNSVLAQHRREVLIQVYAPMAMAVLVIAIVMAALVIGLSPYSFGTVAAFMSLLILVPAAVLCILPYVLLIALAFGVNKLNRWLPGRLHATRLVIHTVNENSGEVVRRVVNPFIWINQRLAWLERFLSFRPPLKALPGPDRKTVK